MLTLPNVATSDAYTAACTLGPVATAQQIVFVVANAAAIAQIAPLLSSGTLGDWGDEILLTPQANVVQRAGGIRFKSAVAGVPAQIVAQLIEPADPAPGAGTPFTAKLSSSGGVTPGAANVQIQKDGALIGTEQAIDFINSPWTFADDAANTRITITVPKVTASLWSAGPPGAPADGDIWIATSVDTGIAGTGTVDWTFRFRAASSKWHFAGGPAYHKAATGLAINCPNSAWTNIPGVRFTTPRNGLFNVYGHAVCATNQAQGAQGLALMSFNSNTISGIINETMLLAGSPTNQLFMLALADQQVPVGGAGGVIDLSLDSNLTAANSFTVSQAIMDVTPVYIV